MNPKNSRLQIDHIHIGFAEVVDDQNYPDSHRPLNPFSHEWGRGILVRGHGYLESVTGPYGITHSKLKTDMEGEEKSDGAFYYGYESKSKTLYLEYASDKNFDFYDKEVLNAIMSSLSKGRGPLKDFFLGEPKK